MTPDHLAAYVDDCLGPFRALWGEHTPMYSDRGFYGRAQPAVAFAVKLKYPETHPLSWWVLSYSPQYQHQ